MKRWISSHQQSNGATLPLNGGHQWTQIHCGHLVNPSPPLRFIYAALAILTLGIVVLTCNVYQLQNLHNEKRLHHHRAPLPVVEAHGHIPTDHDDLRPSALTTTPIDRSKPTAWIHGQNIETGYLDHVMEVFRRIGYNVVQNVDDDNNWDILWSHDYPFIELNGRMKNLKANQKVNHFPGSGFITNKVNLATSNSPHIPRAFKMPNDKDAFLHYVKGHPDKLFVQKNNKHRGIKVNPVSSLNLTQDGSFVQEFIQNPLLIDKRKFDIGIYTIITSIDPLRVYVHNGDALLRFCSVDYHPFNSDDLNKYVVGDDYTPIWEMPSLKYYYEVMGYTMIESFNAYFIKKGKDPKVIWRRIEEAIRGILLEKEQKLILSAKHYKSKRNFYEMVRFDFAVDEDFNVYVMEANMSPNLSSSHFAQNKLLYEQVIYNTLSLLGIANWLHVENSRQSHEDVYKMRISEKDLIVNASSCQANECHDVSNCQRHVCRLCRPCLDDTWRTILMDSHQENMFKHKCRRIIPSTVIANETSATATKLNENNQKLLDWFIGKCHQDASFCN